MENKKTNLTGVIASALLLMVFITASFAYFGMFTVNLENKVAVNIYANDIGNTSFIATSANLNVIVPKSGMFKGNTGLAAENTATLTVNLTGAPNVTTTCTYDVVYEYDLDSEIYGSTVNVTSGATKEITLEVESPSGTNSFASETNFAYDSSWTPKTTTVGAKKVLVKEATITSEGTSVVQNINITGRYYNLDLDQSQLGDKSFTGTIYVENNNCTVKEPPKANEVILLNNGGVEVINAKENSDYTTVATTNEDMYKAEDDQGTSYYFRGAVDNNWLKFGEVDGKPIYWRIIRINGDGSIRLIYTGTTAPTESEKSVMTGTGTQIGTSVFNGDGTVLSIAYVGYKYEGGKQHGLAVDSTIKTALENWYKTTSLYTDTATSKLVTDTPFCYDRSASTSSAGTYDEISNWTSSYKTTYYYGSYGRLQGNKTGPSLKCANELDKYSVANGALSYPVGLITADEVNMAGGFNNDNSSYYLYTGEYYWTGSPSRSDGTMAYIFSVYLSGALDVDVNSFQNYGVRPVINLSSKAKLSGNGTYNNPYIVN